MFRFWITLQEKRKNKKEKQEAFQMKQEALLHQMPIFLKKLRETYDQSDKSFREVVTDVAEQMPTPIREEVMDIIIKNGGHPGCMGRLNPVTTSM